MEKSSGGRRNVAMIAAIVGGLVIGIFIKRVHIGLLIGLGIGLLVSSMIKRK
jgi:uncharacterized protein YqgC (DUF456 family)